MVELFKFIFSSPWNWLGTVILLVIFTMWTPFNFEVKVEAKKNEGND